MRPFIAICTLMFLVAAAEAQKPTYPLNRSPNQKQADYIRSQNPQRVVPNRPRSTNIFVYPNYNRRPYSDPYYYNRYGRRPYYGPYYRPYYGPVYPITPVIRPWPISPYPFRLP